MNVRAALGRSAALGWRLFKAACFITGFIVLVVLPSCRASTFLYVDENFRSVRYPGGGLEAFRQVTRGGFGTVWTTRILVEDVATREQAIIYEARDSDWIPTFRWTGAEALQVTIPCDRVDYLGSPADWDEGATPMQRFSVRFRYPQNCQALRKGLT